MSSICYIQYSEHTFLYTRQSVPINIYMYFHEVQNYQTNFFAKAFIFSKYVV